MSARSSPGRLAETGPRQRTLNPPFTGSNPVSPAEAKTASRAALRAFARRRGFCFSGRPLAAGGGPVGSSSKPGAKSADVWARVRLLFVPLLVCRCMAGIDALVAGGSVVFLLLVILAILPGILVFIAILRMGAGLKATGEALHNESGNP